MKKRTQAAGKRVFSPEGERTKPGFLPDPAGNKARNKARNKAQDKAKLFMGEKDFTSTNGSV